MVQERLVRANLRRNHRFRYSQRHALKLEQDRYRPSGRADQRSDVHPDTIPEPGNLQGAIKNQSDQPNTDTKTDTNLFPGKESTLSGQSSDIGRHVATIRHCRLCNCIQNQNTIPTSSPSERKCSQLQMPMLLRTSPKERLHLSS
ncbi:hypothetical protein K458DRAFT_40007 [Lentithecium fluviatile CBS 122367]|uniref:Uncharacterized protein n=1 Tax=Lentithecium fluviatile CBS 122367 TaxID=1168545 RepID=A0A6G1IZV3_9PLEO|nr:hypothetical protein K458DRAFT_40007 [Lentithecium fluviatile CBS 122367]